MQVTQTLIPLTPPELNQMIDAAVSNAFAKRVPATQEHERLYTRHQVAEMLDVDLATLHRWARTGKLPAYGIGNRVYYRRTDIDAALTRISTGTK